MVSLVQFNEFLKSQLTPHNRFEEAIYYACNQSGKRIRPLLFLACLADLGLPPMMDIALGIELIHISTLVHDDLPGLDNDDYRRGELTVHKKFDEASAILAGDSLLIKGIELISNATLADGKKIKMINLLTHYTNGVMLGQFYDLSGGEMKQIIQLKTANLLTIPFIFAFLIAEINFDEVIKIGTLLGEAFQLQDDLDDEILPNYLGNLTRSDVIQKIKELYQLIYFKLEQIGCFVEVKKILEKLERRQNHGH